MSEEKELSKEEILELRSKHLSSSLSVSYGEENALHIVRGSKQYLYDTDDTRYLDCSNNVCHVGHCHPSVVKAASQQLSTLNTNTRYLHSHIVRYAQKLTSLFPSPLDCVLFTNSGSEANELALRLARAYHNHNRNDIMAVQHGYHGNTTSLIQLSSYKLVSQPIKPLSVPISTHIIDIADPYRGKHTISDDNTDEDDICNRYINDLQSFITDNHRKNKIGAMLIESISGCGGQIYFPKNYLKKVLNILRKFDILMIADEVQCGFGRCGEPYYWGFQHNSGLECIPDIVTLGKPIGNGFPLGAVITTPKIMNAFRSNNNGMEYFNTFGGNPVASIVGLTVLQIIESEKLLKRASMIGDFLKSKLIDLQSKWNHGSLAGVGSKPCVLIGDIRGKGFFLGIEFVLDLGSRKPATEICKKIVNEMVKKPYCVLLGRDGPHNNVIKFKPPMSFSQSDATHLVKSLTQVLILLNQNQNNLFSAKL